MTRYHILCTIYVDRNRAEYIALEQKNTLYDLSKKVLPAGNEKNNEIIISLDSAKCTQQDVNILQQFSQIIKDSGGIGEFQLGNLFISIIKMNEYQNELIKL